MYPTSLAESWWDYKASAKRSRRISMSVPATGDINTWDTPESFRDRARAFVHWLSSALPPHVNRVVVVSHGGFLVHAFPTDEEPRLSADSQDTAESADMADVKPRPGGKYHNCEWRVFDIERQAGEG
eukprot:g3808.t1